MDNLWEKAPLADAPDGLPVSLVLFPAIEFKLPRLPFDRFKLLPSLPSDDLPSTSGPPL